MGEPEFDPDEDPDDPGWYTFNDEELDVDDPFLIINFALGFPYCMSDVEDWVSLRHVVVDFDEDEVWISWEAEPDPVMEMEYATRIARLALARPWEAIWSCVDPKVCLWLTHMRGDPSKRGNRE